MRAGQRTGQAEYPPRLSLQQREHVQPAQTLQHQAGAPIALHGADQLRGDAPTVQLGQGHHLRAVPEDSRTVQLDDPVVAPRVHLRLAAGAELGSDHPAAPPGPTFTRPRPAVIPVAGQPHVRPSRTLRWYWQSQRRPEPAAGRLSPHDRRPRDTPDSHGHTDGQRARPAACPVVRRCPRRRSSTRSAARRREGFKFHAHCRQSATPSAAAPEASAATIQPASVSYLAGGAPSPGST